jgi:hypothetical protein
MQDATSQQRWGLAPAPPDSDWRVTARALEAKWRQQRGPGWTDNNRIAYLAHAATLHRSKDLLVADYATPVGSVMARCLLRCVGLACVWAGRRFVLLSWFLHFNRFRTLFSSVQALETPVLD